MKANRSLALASDDGGNMQQVAVGAIITIVIAGILGVIGLSIMDGVTQSINIEDTTYTYTDEELSGNQTIDIQDGVINSATMVVTNADVEVAFTVDIAGESSEKTIAQSESDTWSGTPEAEATSVTVTTDSTDFDYTLTIVVDSGSQFTEAHASLLSGITGAFGMSATLLLVVIAVAIVGLVIRLAM